MSTKAFAKLFICFKPLESS